MLLCNSIVKIQVNESTLKLKPKPNSTLNAMPPFYSSNQPPGTPTIATLSPITNVTGTVISNAPYPMPMYRE